MQGQIYTHDFGSIAISGSPYTVAPGTLDAQLSNSSWSSSTGNFTSYAGAAGQALSLSNSGGTPTYTLTFDVASGYTCTIDSFNFWQQRSASGAQNWSLSINAISVGAGTVPTSGSALGNTAVSTPVSQQTGTITIVLSLSGASGTGTFRLDDFTLYGSVDTVITSGYDTNSEILAPATQTSASTPTSLADSAHEAFDVLQFYITDSASGDSKATRITNVRLMPAVANTADWTDHIAGVLLSNGSSITTGLPTIADGYIDIPVAVGDLDISDGSTDTITASVYLHTGGITDNAVLAFLIDADAHGFSADTSGSELATTINGGTDITGNSHTIAVTATALTFGQQPSDTWQNTAMSPSVTVSANDANSNRDTDYITDISITSTGTLSSTPIDATPVSGLATFATLTHTSTGSGLQLTAASGALTTAQSDTFSITAIPQQGLSLAATNTLYAITFDSTVSGVNEGQFNGSGISASPSSGMLNSYGLSIVGLSEGNVSFGGSNTSGDFARGTGSGGVSTGGMYAFEVASGNYALGFQPTGTDFVPGEVALKLQNNTGDTLFSLLMAYDLYTYNDQGRSTMCEVYFSDDNSSYSKNDTLSVSTTETAMASPAWRVDYASHLLQGLSLAPGDYYYVKWSFIDNGGSGSRDEIALDNIRFIAYKTSKSLTTIASQLSGDYNSLVINGNGNSEASGNIIVYNHIKFYKGHLVLNNYQLTLGDADTDCALSGAGASSFVIPGTGTLRYYVNNSSGTYLFPYGSGSDYTPAEVVFSSATLAGTDYLESTLSAQKHPNFSGYVSHYIARNWTIEATGITAPVYSLTLNYADGDVNGVESSILPVKYSGGTWTAPSNIGNNNVDTVGTGAVDVSNNALTWNNVDGFSVFGGAGNGTPLPVELQAFGALRNGTQVAVGWQTAGERNSSRFVVEHSTDGNYFVSIGELDAAGNSAQATTYRYSHFYPVEGYNYYRLRMEDNDGASTRSRIAVVSPLASSESSGFDVRLMKQNGINGLLFDGMAGTLVEVRTSDILGRQKSTQAFLLSPGVFIPLRGLVPNAVAVVRVQCGEIVKVFRVMGE
jgi:hypothetical protein